jgi:two-component system, cell cycle sensor histidine kinase and response regulator CckA
MCEYLRRVGYEVFGSASAKNALLLLEAHKAKPRILVTDLVVPGDGGWLLTRQARQRFPHLPIVFMSGCIEMNRPTLISVFSDQRPTKSTA